MPTETIPQVYPVDSDDSSGIQKTANHAEELSDQQRVDTELKKIFLMARVETNFARLPVWALKPKRGTVFVPKKTIVLEPETLPDGQILERKIEILPSAFYGYPTVQTQEYWYALQLLWASRPKQSRISFSRREIIEGILGKTCAKKTIQAFDLSLHQLSTTTFAFYCTFVDKEKGITHSEIREFSIISDLHLTEKKSKNTVVKDKCSLELHPLIFSNLRAGYYKPIILSTVSQIKSDIARLLYSKIDFQFSHHDRYEITTSRFFEEQGIQGSEYHYPSRRKRLLEKAIKELLGKPTSKEATGGCKGDALIASYEILKTADGRDYKLVVHSSRIASVGSIEARPEDASGVEISAKGKKQPTLDGKDDALKLFYFFDQVFFDRSGASPSKKELEASRKLVEKYGLEKCKFLVQSAHANLSNSQYKPKSFLGIIRNIGEIETQKIFEKSQEAKIRLVKKKQEKQQAKKRAQREEFQRQHESEYHAYILDLEKVFLYRHPKEFALFGQSELQQRTQLENSVKKASTAFKRRMGESELRVFNLAQRKVARLLKHFCDHSEIKFPTFWEWAAKHHNQKRLHPKLL